MESSSSTSTSTRYDVQLSAEENAYIESLSVKEYQAYLIARDHLGILLTVHKINGFLQWKKTRKS
jgi:hypothetical protein